MSVTDQIFKTKDFFSGNVWCSFVPTRTFTNNPPFSQETNSVKKNLENE